MPTIEPVEIRGTVHEMMHDWWAALVASRCGRIVTISDTLVRYRQHGHNTVGMGTGGTRRWNRLSYAFVVERFSRASSRARKTVSLDLLLTRLLPLQQRFGGSVRPITLLSRARRRDLLEFVRRYRLLSQSPLTSLILVTDILRWTSSDSSSIKVDTRL